MATNKVSFYYRKDLGVTKHGEYKAAVNMDFGSAVKRNEATGEVELAADSAAFEGVVDKIIYNVQGDDDLTIKAGELVRTGVGSDYEIVLMAAKIGGVISKGTEVEVLNGAFQTKTTDTAVGKVVEKFANGETVIRIY